MLLVDWFQTGVSVWNQPTYVHRTKQTRNMDVPLKLEHNHHRIRPTVVIRSIWNGYCDRGSETI